MHVCKRNGAVEPVDLNKIVSSLERYCNDLPGVDVYRIATKTVGGLVDGVTTRDLDLFSVSTASNLIQEDPVYSNVAGRILANVIAKEVSGQDIQSFSQSIDVGYREGLISEATHTLVMANKRKLNGAVKHDRDWYFEYHGIQTVYDRYLLKHPTAVIESAGQKQRMVIETPQYFLMRVACGLAEDAGEAIELYNLLSSLEYMASTPTLFNSGTRHSQMSSCYLLDSPLDDLHDLYKRYGDIAALSKFAGGIGVSMSRIRGTGSLIRGTNGKSNGIIPWLHTLSGSVAAVNQCLHPETRIVTETGLKPIKDIVAGTDRVLGISGYYRPVQEVLRYDSTEEPSVVITMRHGNKPLGLTIGHPVFAITGVPTGESHARIMRWLDEGKLTPTWAEAGSLKTGDFIGTPVPQVAADVEGFSVDDAYFYGLMLGDGHLTQRKTCDSVEGGISYHPTAKAAYAEFVRKYLARRGIHTWTTAFPDRPNYEQIKWTATSGLPFGYDDLYDQNGDKSIAPCLMHLPAEKCVALMQGLIDSDGCISRGKEITFTSASMPLVESLRYQLLRLSVMSGMQTRRRKDERSITRADGAETIIRYDNDYSDVRVPAFRELAERLGVPEVTKSHWLRYGGMVWSRVKQVESIPTPNQVYDLRVEFDETYTTSEGLVHNGGKRKGAACVYIEPHHPDILEFLELRDNTGEKEKRAHNLNFANWVSDLFMNRVKADALWSLFDPSVAPELTDLYGEEYEARYAELEAAGKFTAQVPARKIYARMMQSLAETGNGWMCFKDTANRRGNQVGDGRIVHLSNLCVAPETLILTDRGYLPIGALEDEQVRVWNGETFSDVTVRKTGTDQPLLRVAFDNGAGLDCTPYHKYYVMDGNHVREVRAAELKAGDKLIKHALPVIQGDLSFGEPYTHGFFCGDGTYLTTGQPGVSLYAEKKALVPFLALAGGSGKEDTADRLNYRLPPSLPPKFVVPSARHRLHDRLDWLAGLLDADGTVSRNGANQSLQIGSVNRPFLIETQLMLQTLGVNAKVTHMREAGEVCIREGEATYPTQAMHRLLITSVDVQHLLSLGLRCHRLSIKPHQPNRDARHFVRVQSVTDMGRTDDTYCFSEPLRHMGMFNGVLTGNCTEILEVTSSGKRRSMTREEMAATTASDLIERAIRVVGFDDQADAFEVIEGGECAVCNLGSINIGRGYIKNGKLDKEKLRRNVAIAIKYLDRVIDRNFYPIPEARASNMRWRPVGLGLMGLADLFFQLRLPYDSDEAIRLSGVIQEEIYYQALVTSNELAQTHGAHRDFALTRAAKGLFQHDLAGVTPSDVARWDALRAKVMQHGLRNSLLIAIAPTATISHICGVEECIEPIKANLLKRETLSGEFIAINRYLVEDLKRLGVWNTAMMEALVRGRGSVAGMTDLPEDIRALYKTAWEMSMKAVIGHGVARGAYVDQSASTNMFVDLNKHAPHKRIGVLSSLYMMAWEAGLKTTYYLRGQTATTIKQTTVRDLQPEQMAPETPEICESCT